MPTEDPRLSAWRQAYVQRIVAKQLRERRNTTQQLFESQEEVRHFLKNSHFDRTIRQVFSNLQCSFKSTKIDKNLLPLAGQLNDTYSPAFTIDHQGLPGFSNRFEYPGLVYSSYVGLDEVVISVTICKDDLGNVFPHIIFTHRNGRTHQIDRQSVITSPSPEELTYWLNLELFDYFPSRKRYEVLILGDYHISTQNTKYD